MKLQRSMIVALILAHSQVGICNEQVVQSRTLNNSIPVSSEQRIKDGLAAELYVVGVFQYYDPSKQIVRISNVDYNLDPSRLKISGKLREFRNGQSVQFTHAGVSEAGRNVLTSIKLQ